MAQKTKIDWNKAKVMYVSDSTVSYLAVSKAFGVSHKAVKERGLKERWRDQRVMMSEKVTERLIDRTVDELAEVNERHTNIYKRMQALGLSELNIAMNEIVRLQEQAKVTGRPLNLRKEGVIGQQSLKFLFDGLKIAMDGERITLGLPTAVSVSKNEITGKDGNVLFEGVNLEEINAKLTRAVTALGQGDSPENSA
jgi:hypothetical protein